MHTQIWWNYFFSILKSFIWSNFKCLTKWNESGMKASIWGSESQPMSTPYADFNVQFPVLWIHMNSFYPCVTMVVIALNIFTPTDPSASYSVFSWDTVAADPAFQMKVHFEHVPDVRREIHRCFIVQGTSFWNTIIEMMDHAFPSVHVQNISHLLPPFSLWLWKWKRQQKLECPPTPWG